MDLFLPILFSIGFGFGVAYLVSASLLVKENSIGDEKGEMRNYCSGVSFTYKQDGASSPSQVGPLKEPTFQLAPKGTAPVEKPKEWTDNNSPMLEDPERTYKPQPPRKRDNPSSFPRSFHDV